MTKKVSVQHWRHEDGWRSVPQVFRNKDPSLPEKEFNPEMVGWFCWVFTSNYQEFEEWMQQNMVGKYDCTPRFNSGNPMTTVWIREDEDATKFKLKWM
jgi:hypothetical protein